MGDTTLSFHQPSESANNLIYLLYLLLTIIRQQCMMQLFTLSCIKTDMGVVPCDGCLSILFLETMLRLIKKMNTAIALTMRPATSRPSTVLSPVTAPVVSVLMVIIRFLFTNTNTAIIIHTISDLFSIIVGNCNGW